MVGDVTCMNWFKLSNICSKQIAELNFNQQHLDQKATGLSPKLPLSLAISLPYVPGGKFIPFTTTGW